jgi:hypothetical protein
MMWRVIAAVCLLAACTPAPRPAVVPPRPVSACPPAPPQPALLPSVVTTERLRSGFRLLELARQAERRRGDACARALDEINAWISSQSELMRRAASAAPGRRGL